MKQVEQRMSDLSLLIKHTTTYRQLKPIYDEYRKSPDKEKYLRGHESEIILFEAAARALKEMQIKKLPDLAALRKEYRSLNDRKTKLYEDYRQAKKQTSLRCIRSLSTENCCSLPLATVNCQSCGTMGRSSYFHFRYCSL